jgi:hypothetical protein
MVGAHPGPGVSAEAKVLALEEVLQSETFARSERLKALLRFLCESEINGREHQLNEYSIGTLALGRPADFAPLEDSSVRSRAHELRQRLEKYYAQESPSAPVRIEFRKGSYVPRFCLVREEHLVVASSETVPVSEVVADVAADPAAAARKAFPNRSIWAVVAAFAFGAATMFALLAFWSAVARPGVRIPVTDLETTSGNGWNPELETLWRPFIANANPLLIAFETRFFVRMGPLMVRDWHVNSPDNVRDSDALTQVQRLFDFRRYGNRDYTDGGTPSALFYLTRLLSGRIPAMSLKNSLDVTAADLRDNNMILLGKPGMDPEIERILSRGELIDAGGKIVNVHPGPGEQAEYRDQSDPTNPDRWGQKYSVITMMPGSSGGKRILALTASGSEQPAALAYYMTNPDTVRDLVGRMHRSGAVPPNYFQVLIRAEYKTKGVLKVDYITHRALKVQ